MTVESQPAKDSSLLVTFTYVDGSGTPPWKLTDASEDLSTRLGDFISDPSLEVKLPANSISGFGKSEATITISTERWLFATLISSGRAFPPTTVKIQERIETADDNIINTLFIGVMTRASRNPNQKLGQVKIYCASDKNSLETILGFSGNPSCGWTFGNAKTCGVNLVPLMEPATFNFQDNKFTKVTLSGLASHSNRYWRRGKVKRGDLEIKIREWLNGTDFYLSQLPPLDWEGQSVEVYPGCDKRVVTCIFWDNLEFFSGIGLKALDYNPIFENPKA